MSEVIFCDEVKVSGELVVKKFGVTNLHKTFVSPAQIMFFENRTFGGHKSCAVKSESLPRCAVTFLSLIALTFGVGINHLRELLFSAFTVHCLHFVEEIGQVVVGSGNSLTILFGSSESPDKFTRVAKECGS